MALRVMTRIATMVCLLSVPICGAYGDATVSVEGNGHADAASGESHAEVNLDATDIFVDGLGNPYTVTTSMAGSVSGSAFSAGGSVSVACGSNFGCTASGEIRYDGNSLLILDGAGPLTISQLHVRHESTVSASVSPPGSGYGNAGGWAYVGGQGAISGTELTIAVQGPTASVSHTFIAYAVVNTSQPGGGSVQYGGSSSLTISSLTPGVTARLAADCPSPGPAISVPEYGGGQYVDGVNGVPPTSTRVIVTHGKSDRIRFGDNSHWSNGVLQNVFSEYPGASVVGWDWSSSAATAVPDDLLTLLTTSAGSGGGDAIIDAWLGRAYRNAQKEGDELGDQLIDAIEDGQYAPNDVVLVGHSFGGVANGIAAKKVHDHFKSTLGDHAAKIGRQVVLDTPQMSFFLPATTHIDIGAALRTENYYGPKQFGATGGEIEGAVNVEVDVGARGASLTGGIDNLGHNWIAKLFPQLSGLMRFAPPGSYTESYENGVSTIESGPPRYIPGEPFYGFPETGLVPSFFMEAMQDFIGQDACLEEIAGRFAVKMGNHGAEGANATSGRGAGGMGDMPAAQFYREFTIPADADYLQFDLFVATPQNGDWLSVSFENTLLYLRPLYDATSEFVTSDPVFVGDLAGTTGLITFSLWDELGGGAAEVYVNNFRLFDVADTAFTNISGDYNFDRTVDAADYVVWRKNDGTTEGFNIWRANFGNTLGGSGSALNVPDGSPAVPEPTSLLLLILAGTLIMSRRVRPMS